MMLSWRAPGLSRNFPRRPIPICLQVLPRLDALTAAMTTVTTSLQTLLDAAGTLTLG